METKTAAAKKNGSFGYKAVVKYGSGRTHIPVRKNFATAELAKAYAEKWIGANDGRPAIKHKTYRVGILTAH